MKVGYRSLGYYGSEVEILYTDGVFHIIDNFGGYQVSYRDEKETYHTVVNHLGCHDDEYYCDSIKNAILEVKQFTTEV